jgi:hypothetical protein
MQTGSVIDFYDDPSGTVLKTKLAYAQLPDYIRQADYQSEEKLAALPDDAFALVMVDQGQKIRKFACVDKGNTALSALYFLENKDKLPEEAQKVAAANLVEYCQAFQIEPPWQLQKVATKAESFAKILSSNAGLPSSRKGIDLLRRSIAHKTGQMASAVAREASSAGGHEAGVSRLTKDVGYGKFKRTQAEKVFPKPGKTKQSAFWNSPKDTLSKGDAFAKELEKMEAAGKDMNNLSWKELSDVKGKAKANLGAGKKKSADLTGSAIMPLQSNPNKEADEDSQLKATDEKRAGLLDRITMMKGAPGKLNALKDFEKSVQPQLAKRLHVDTSGKFPPPPPSGWFSLKSASLEKRAFWNSPKDTLTKGDAFAKELERMEAAGKDMNNLSWKELADVKGKAKAKIKSGKTKEGSNLYVDITGKSPPPQFEKRAHSRYCLEKLGQGRFPIDSYGEVLEANKWFEENGKSLHPQDRREYCTKLAARAGELHISVTDNIRKYAGKNFAPADDVRASVCTRMQFWADDAPERDTLSGMLDKYASASPDQFCQELTAFDVKTGLDQYWDDFIVDPVACVFGMEKTAEWLWEQGADRLTEDLLHVGVNDSQKIHAIKAKFGTELASELVEKPSEVFDSLPLDSKRIIARILNDTQP